MSQSGDQSNSPQLVGVRLEYDGCIESPAMSDSTTGVFLGLPNVTRLLEKKECSTIGSSTANNYAVGLFKAILLKNPHFLPITGMNIRQLKTRQKKLSVPTFGHSFGQKSNECSVTPTNRRWLKQLCGTYEQKRRSKTFTLILNYL